MKALVVYDSVFGNTEKVAQAVAQAMSQALDAEVPAVRVGDVQPGQWKGVQVLVAGSPTRAFQPTPATKQFLKNIPHGDLKGVKVAAFDTRMNVSEVNSAILTFFVKIFGYAAQPIANRLQRKGGELAVPAEGFFVEGSEGPLKDGELERAAAWAKSILAAQ